MGWNIETIHRVQASGSNLRCIFKWLLCYFTCLLCRQYNKSSGLWCGVGRVRRTVNGRPLLHYSAIYSSQNRFMASASLWVPLVANGAPCFTSFLLVKQQPTVSNWIYRVEKLAVAAPLRGKTPILAPRINFQVGLMSRLIKKGAAATLIWYGNPCKHDFLVELDRDVSVKLINHILLLLPLPFPIIKTQPGIASFPWLWADVRK